MTRRGLLASLLASGVAARAADFDPAGAIEAALGAIPAGPALIPSYIGPDVPLPLRDVAFVYDNAVALIALRMAGNRAGAARIGEALLIALDHDRFWRDGRLRNAYRAGPMTAPAPLPGYWNKQKALWSEDAYQVGSATGVVAWAALAFFHLADFDLRFDQGARRLCGWLAGPVWSETGVIGGFFGEEPHPIRQTWQSTEQNIDVAVVLRRAGMDQWRTCRDFVARAFDPARGCFAIGSGGGPTALDANLWALLGFADAPPAWRRALAWVRAHYQSEGGLGFRERPDGMWTEGTAQGAITFARAGDGDFAGRLLAALPAMQGYGGFLRAAKHEIRTGLAVGPTSTTDDFRYFPLPHLGATAWAALARRGGNPFVV